VQRGIVESISEEWLRVLLHEDEVSLQSIRTWKTCLEACLMLCSGSALPWPLRSP
jgi:hypothetical protein